MKYRISSYLLIAFALILFSCNKNNISEEKIETEIILNDSILEFISIDTAIIRSISTPIKLSGEVSFIKDKIVEVFSLFGGNVVEVHAELGDYVKKGSPLATIRSSEIADFQQEEIEAKTNLEIANKNFEIIKGMANSGLSSEKDLLFAQKELDNAKAKLRKIKEIISIYNIYDNSLYSLKSPISGFVVEKNITREMQLRSDNNLELFTISDLDEVWIIANVYESDISKIGLNNPAIITISAFPNMVFESKIEKIYNILNSESKTMTIRIKLPNPNYKLKPGMFAQVETINNELKSQKEVSIDKNALIFDNDKQYVVKIRTDNKFEIQEVKIKTTTSKYAAISSGLEENDKIINKNAILIFNAISDN